MKKLLLLLAFCLNALSQQVMGQGCSVCTKTTAGLDEGSARGLNGGIMYLAAIPLLALATISYIWWRKNRVES